MELYNATLRFSVGSLQSTTVFSLPLSVPPFGILTTQVDVVLSNGLLSLTLNSSTCQMTPDCHVSSNINSSGLMLGGLMYVGGVPHWTPFMRSKAKSTNGFIGCLGVSQNQIISPLCFIMIVMTFNLLNKTLKKM